ncbi:MULTISPECIES: hypothetical protein [Halogeometricum]|uniref:Transposase DDE domain-containing protein n=2 Tax=Halogeometricum TaxID=60846 RepID=A0ABU2G867_9EURY|nr:MULTISPECIES: hypothetical protein [unclassified Halogeometricum]MDS0296631.1 hypothetical protein [Halogeometricum sp. S3BR5-2]MDS0301433.1 hypothetical protein [Halogeometricum sp. S1BR25-6]
MNRFTGEVCDVNLERTAETPFRPCLQVGQEGGDTVVADGVPILRVEDLGFRKHERRPLGFSYDALRDSDADGVLEVDSTGLPIRGDSNSKRDATNYEDDHKPENRETGPHQFELCTW